MAPAVGQLQGPRIAEVSVAGWAVGAMHVGSLLSRALAAAWVCVAAFVAWGASQMQALEGVLAAALQVLLLTRLLQRAPRQSRVVQQVDGHQKWSRELLLHLSLPKERQLLVLLLLHAQLLLLLLLLTLLFYGLVLLLQRPVLLLLKFELRCHQGPRYMLGPWTGQLAGEQALGGALQLHCAVWGLQQPPQLLALHLLCHYHEGALPDLAWV